MAFSAIAQRRIAQFRRNRRGYVSLWIFAALFLFSVFAEFVANDKPIFISYDGGYYAPVFRSYAETEFGGEFETEADYRDPAVAELINKKGWMIWPPIRYSYQTINYNLDVPAPSPPTRENLLGTDDQARDVLARLIYGFRISIIFGLTLTLLGSAFGMLVGAMEGYLGGLFDLLTQRFIEIWSGMPVFFLLIIMSSIITPGFFTLLGLMLLFSWMTLVDVVRAEFLKARNLDYIRAAKALGVSTPVIMFKHALPNAMVASLSMMPFVLAGSITTLTSLDFLGFGMPPGSPSLGELLSQGKNNLQAPWLGMTAFFSVAVMLSLLTFIGEAVRDAFDPRKIFKG
ncbi:MAG: ABC transporter permease [Alphaproteobacteria bacterium]|nr:ABC transporter permease [Alphaproteobacteria bacterium]